MVSQQKRIEASLARLRNTFTVDSTSPSGLRWKHSARFKIGDAAGRLTSQGYWVVKLDNVGVLVHRIIWILANETIIPDGMTMDHKDGNRRNNRIENLQVVTNAENSRARNKVNKTNKTGFLGVSKHQKGDWWIARFHRDNTFTYLGCFDNPADAARAYNAAVIAWATEHGEKPRYLNLV